MKKYLVLVVLAFSTHSFAGSQTCAHVNNADLGFLSGTGKVSVFKSDLELKILKSFDLIFYPNGAPAKGCESIPVDYSCSRSTHCTGFCIASTVSEFGSNVNTVYKVDQCKNTFQLLDEAVEL